jgi:glycosyltransferase involved in cell wall biosynthesis
LETFSSSKQWYRTPISAFGGLPDVVHINYIGEWLDLPSFFKDIPLSTPIVWTLHDMNPMTGGCHYSFGCDKYKATCESCPQLSSHRSGYLSTEGQILKQELLKGRNLHIVTNSHWLTAEAQKSTVLKEAKSFSTIHYGIDTAVFAPADKQAIRAELNIPDDAYVVAFGASSVVNKRKGFSYLLAALGHLAPHIDRLYCLTFGRSQISPDQLPAGVEVRSAGHLDDPAALARVYSAADVFVVPSLEEAFGLTALESLCCEVPVVGFAVGGIPDTVRPGQTGWLAKPADSMDLAAQIRKLHDNPDQARQMGQTGRQIAKDFFSYDRQRAAYMALYTQLVTPS